MSTRSNPAGKKTPPTKTLGENVKLLCFVPWKYSELWTECTHAGGNNLASSASSPKVDGQHSSCLEGPISRKLQGSLPTYKHPADKPFKKCKNEGALQVSPSTTSIYLV